MYIITLEATDTIQQCETHLYQVQGLQEWRIGEEMWKEFPAEIVFDSEFQANQIGK